MEIGEMERHLVEVKINQLAGTTSIRVDQKPVYRSHRFFNEPIYETYQFVVGQLEKSAIRIEKERKQLFGYRNRVYVDNRLARVYEGV
jgi:hypothetical protein